MNESTPLDYFTALYAAEDDPYGFQTRWYERRKYAVTLASLPHERYRRAFEPGCSVGVLTELLAARCDSLVAWEPVARAAGRARERVAGLGHVTVEQAAVPEGWPDGGFDLVVLSELLYFLDADRLRRTLELATGCLARDGALVVVDWRAPFAEAPTSGEQVHAELSDRLDRAGLRRVVHHEEPEFLLDVAIRPTG